MSWIWTLVTILLCALYLHNLVVSSFIVYWGHKKTLDANVKPVTILSGFSIGALLSIAILSTLAYRAK